MKKHDKIMEKIKKALPCMDNVGELGENYADAGFYQRFINVDDRKDYSTANLHNTEFLSTLAKQLDVSHISFDRLDAYPDGTSMYSCSVDYHNTEE